MTIKLKQRTLLNGTREFELTDDVVNVRIKKLLKEEKLTVGLSILNHEAVTNEPYLEFYDRYNGNKLLSLLLNKPNADKFNTFVNALKQKTLEEYNTSTAHSTGAQNAELTANAYEEPPEFKEYDQDQIRNKGQKIDVADIDIALKMLNKYMDSNDINPLLTALETLKTEPQNEAFQVQVVKAFNELGVLQGAVLTYAPYLNVFVSDDPFGDN